MQCDRRGQIDSAGKTRLEWCCEGEAAAPTAELAASDMADKRSKKEKKQRAAGREEGAGADGTAAAQAANKVSAAECSRASRWV